jgi:hypothetical protein
VRRCRAKQRAGCDDHPSRIRACQELGSIITFMAVEQKRGVSEASISQVFSRGTARPLPTRKGLIQPKRQQRHHRSLFTNKAGKNF